MAESEREKEDELKVTSLKVVFSGYSFYADHAGRFSAVRLVSIVGSAL
jgi:hypothetical protein